MSDYGVIQKEKTHANKNCTDCRTTKKESKKRQKMSPKIKDLVPDDFEKSGELPRVTLRLRKETIEYILEKQQELQLPSYQQTILELIRRAEIADELKEIYRRTLGAQISAMEKHLYAVENKYREQAWEFRKLRSIEASSESNAESILQLRSEIEDVKNLVTAEMEERILLCHKMIELERGRPRTRLGVTRRRAAKKAPSYPLSVGAALREASVAEPCTFYKAGTAGAAGKPATGKPVTGKSAKEEAAKETARMVKSAREKSAKKYSEKNYSGKPHRKEKENT